MYPLAVNSPHIGKEKQIIMSTCRKEPFNKIFFIIQSAGTGTHSNHSFASPALGSVGAHVGSFNETFMCHCNNDPLIGNKVLNSHLSRICNQQGTPLCRKASPDIHQLFLDDIFNPNFAGKNILQIQNGIQQALVFCMNFILFQTG